MKIIITALLSILTASTALADRWDDRHDDRRYGHQHRPQHHWHGSNWVAPLVILGVAGAAAAAASRSTPAPVVLAPPPLPEPVYLYPSVTAAPVVSHQSIPYAVAPLAPVTMAAPNAVAYYCPSYGQFHPQVQVCPGGWQLVAVPR